MAKIATGALVRKLDIAIKGVVNQWLSILRQKRTFLRAGQLLLGFFRADCWQDGMGGVYLHPHREVEQR